MTDFASLQAKMRDVLSKPGFLMALQPHSEEPSSLSTVCSSKWESQSSRRRSHLSHWALVIIPILFLAVIGLYFLLMDIGDAGVLIEERRNGTGPIWQENTVETIIIQEEIEPTETAANSNNVKTAASLPSTLQTILQSETTLKSVELTTQKSPIAEEMSTVTFDWPTTVTNASAVELTSTTKATTVEVQITTKAPAVQVRPTTKSPLVEVTITKAETKELHIAPKPKINKTNSTVILLKKDNNGTEFVIEGKRFQHPKEFLKVINAPDLRNRTRAGTVFDDSPSKPLTTPRGFQYSPTVPLQSKFRSVIADTTTSSYNDTSDLNCFSPRIPFCEGILPYDMVQLPRIPDISSFRDLDAMLPYFQLVIQSGCSQRAREFICAVLEPECTPPSAPQSTPCKVSCKVLSEDCKDFILETLPLSRIFDCRRYPDYDENKECLNLAKGKCFKNEFQCPDGSCIPRKWMCDGVHDCPGSKPALDEQECSGCSYNEFRCIMDGRCIPSHWRCDGMADCADYSDESSC